MIRELPLLALAALFAVLGLVFGWRAARSTGSQRSRYWMCCGISCCGMWAEILLVVAMLTL